MSSDDNGKWNVNDYKHALDLVKELQSVIEKQQHEIDYLKQQGTAFRNQNESLRKQRDDLRIRNAQLTSEIANLSRRNSLSASQNGFSERFVLHKLWIATLCVYNYIVHVYVCLSGWHPFNSC